jgi:hypothetical protein
MITHQDRNATLEWGGQVKWRHLANISGAVWVATGRRMWPRAIPQREG